MPNIEVVELSYYPIKSCAGTEAETVTVTSNGFEYDRELMLVDRNGQFLSQRKTPELALVYPRIIGSELYITAPDMEELYLPLTEEGDPGETIEATVQGKPVAGEDQGVEADEWFSEYLSMSVRLLRTRPDLPRYITDRYHHEGAANQVGFADGFPITLASLSSLRVLVTLLDEPVSMNRFRPNIVVDTLGLDETLKPYDEDYWRKIRIGEMSAYVVRACARCEIPDTNQSDGSTGRAVRSVLTRYRRGIDSTDPSGSKGMFFMQNLNHVFHPGLTINLGDEVIVEERADEANFVPINKLAE